MTRPHATAALSIDVEDWFHVENLKGVIGRDTWHRQELRVQRNVDLILVKMAEHDVRGTWFVLGWVAERLPQLVERIAAAGHEIASHGYAHELVSRQTHLQFRDDVDRTKKLLEDIVGREVIGYRAPCFSITDWSIDVLREVGYRYDSSAFPTFGHDRYGQLAEVAPSTAIIELRPGLHEVCVSTLPVAGYGLPWAGGGYFRLLPYRIFRNGVRRILARGTPYVFYIHPWEFDPGQPRPRGLRRSQAFRHYLNLSRVESRFERLLADFDWTSVRDVLERNATPASSTDLQSSAARSSADCRITAAPIRGAIYSPD